MCSGHQGVGGDDPTGSGALYVDLDVVGVLILRSDLKARSGQSLDRVRERVVQNDGSDGSGSDDAVADAAPAESNVVPPSVHICTVSAMAAKLMMGSSFSLAVSSAAPKIEHIFECWRIPK